MINVSVQESTENHLNLKMWETGSNAFDLNRSRDQKGMVALMT